MFVVGWAASAWWRFTLGAWFGRSCYVPNRFRCGTKLGRVFVPAHLECRGDDDFDFPSWGTRHYVCKVPLCLRLDNHPPVAIRQVHF
jgi:hypothetical protein